MGSVSRRLRSNANRDLRRAASAIVDWALRKQTRSADCLACETDQFAEMFVGGWKIRLACRVHGTPSTDLRPPTHGNAPTVGHWHLVMQLHPYERPERPGDWEALADFVSRVAEHTGRDFGSFIEALQPIDSRPHAPHHFMWHDDESVINADYRRVLLRRVLL